MKLSTLTVSCVLCLLVSVKSFSQAPPKGSVLVGMFDGRTPCQDLAHLLEEPKSSDCIKIKWRLFLFKDSISGNPTTFELHGFMRRKPNPRTGNWHIIKGTAANPDAIVYQLDVDRGGPLLLQKADDNILFFLDKDKNIYVGNRDFSYTLNRVEKKL